MSQSVDCFANAEEFDHIADQLIWPRLTGHGVRFYTLSYRGFDGDGDPESPAQPQLARWNRLVAAGRSLGLRFEDPDAGRVYRMHTSTARILMEGQRLVVVADPFDPQEHWGVHAPQDYVQFIEQLRALSGDGPSKVLFVLYLKDGALQSELASSMSLTERRSLAKFWCLRHDDPCLAESFAKIWRYQLQPELLRSWRAE